jgi:tripartite-type tricarboxylate transporter receptor subunit TctC
MAIDSLPAHLPHLKTGKVRILAVASPTRSATLPDIPTMTEAGLPGYVSATNYTLFAPAGTPKSVVALLNKEANAVLQMPDVREKLQAQGIVITGGSVESVERQIPKEMDKWAQVVKTSQLKFD